MAHNRTDAAVPIAHDIIFGDDTAIIEKVQEAIHFSGNDVVEV
jgi:hypothetical protein